MYNRHLQEKQQIEKQQQLNHQVKLQNYNAKHRKQRSERVENYKQRVQSFFLALAKHPIPLGEYIPPVTNITRDMSEEKFIASASPQIDKNGIKKVEQRLKKAQEKLSMLDIVPILRSVAEHEFRSRNKVKEIQLDMRYQSTSPSSKMQRSRSQMSNVKLPTINNPEIKMHFKGLEEMGNRLLSLKNKDNETDALMLRLQTIANRQSAGNVQRTSIQLLKQCKLLRSKTLKAMTSYKQAQNLTSLTSALTSCKTSQTLPDVFTGRQNTRQLFLPSIKHPIPLLI